MVPAIGTSHQNMSSENEAFVVHQRDEEGLIMHHLGVQ